MTIAGFINKYPLIKDDLLSVIDNLSSGVLQYGIIEILSNVEGARLELFDKGVSGVISFAPKEDVDSGVQIHYAKAIGITEADWRYLVETIASGYIKSLR